MDEGLTPRAMTKAEMRDVFIETIRHNARYWATVRGRSVEDKLLGLGFSFLVMLDGGAAGLPPFEIVPVPHESDEARHRENGTNWWPTPYGATRKIVESFGIHGGESLHNLYHVADLPAEQPTIYQMAVNNIASFIRAQTPDQIEGPNRLDAFEAARILSVAFAKVQEDVLADILHVP